MNSFQVVGLLVSVSEKESFKAPSGDVLIIRDFFVSIANKYKTEENRENIVKISAFGKLCDDIMAIPLGAPIEVAGYLSGGKYTFTRDDGTKETKHVVRTRAGTVNILNFI